MQWAKKKTAPKLGLVPEWDFTVGRYSEFENANPNLCQTPTGAKQPF
jgi:hypothetical protein